MDWIKINPRCPEGSAKHSNSPLSPLPTPARGEGKGGKVEGQLEMQQQMSGEKHIHT